MDEPEVIEPLQQTIESIAELHAENLVNVSPAQLRIERFTRVIGRPVLAWTAIAFVVLWVAVNLVIARAGGTPIDRPQFPWLQLVLSLASLLVTVLVLIVENRLSEVSDRRAQVTLQIALLAERKTAKIIAILEEMRRDDPHLPDRVDTEAERMSEATDLRNALERLDDAQSRAVERQGE